MFFAWYEIASLDYYFEKNLQQVAATYSLRLDGKVKVDNKGFNTKKEKWEESIGKAVSVDDPTEAFPRRVCRDDPAKMQGNFPQGAKLRKGAPAGKEHLR